MSGTETRETVERSGELETRPPTPTVKYVLFYESADNIHERARPHFPAHAARLEEFHDRGLLLLVGAFGDPQDQGSMAIFRTRQAAEEFVAGDPFVLNGVIRAWELREWQEFFGG